MTNRPRIGPIATLGALLVALLLAAGWWLLHHHSPTAAPSAATSTSPQTYPAASPPDPTASPSPTATTPTPTAKPLSGNALAIAWLHAYLDRTDAAGTDWKQAIAPYSDPALAPTLADPPNQIGLDWPASKITKITPANQPDQPVSTISRQVSGWIVTLTDPTHPTQSTTRAYTLTAYRGQADTWWITFAQQDYTSNG